MKAPVILIIFILCIVGTYLYQRWAQKQFLQKLYEIRKTGKPEEYLAALDSRYAKLNLSDGARLQMKVNYCIQNDREEDVQKLADSMDGMKLSLNEKAEILFQIFGYYVQKDNSKECGRYKTMLDQILEHPETQEQELIKGETEQMYRVFIQKDVNMIPDLEETLADIQNPEVKMVICTRLAYLYRLLGLNEKAESYEAQGKGFAKEARND